jgi:hypothetical protein
LILTPFAINAARADGSAVRCKNQTLNTGTVVTGNIEVPSGAFCDLNGAHVTGSATVESKGGLALDVGAMIDGNVTIERNGQFAARGSSVIGGDVKCHACAVADLNSSTVNGGLVDNGLTQGVLISNSHVGGSLLILGSRDAGFGFSISSTSVGSDLKFDKNKGTSTISGNTITNSLVCNGNRPPPSGSGNTAATKSGQCAHL